MALKQRSLSISLALVLLLGAFSSPVAASELSDAEKTHGELRAAYQRYFETLNGISAKETEAQDCISKFTGSTNATDITKRNECQATLSRLRDERTTLVASEQNSKSRILELEELIQRLRDATSTSAAASGGGASTQSSITPLIPEVVEKKAEEPQVVPGVNAAANSPSEEQSQLSTAAQTPTPAQNSESQAATSAPTPSLSPSPSAVSGSKVSATPKPVVKKKKTITCVKGKVTRKVTAVKPVCPKGFKVKKK